MRKTDLTQFLGLFFKGAKIRWSDNAFREFKRRVKRWTFGPHARQRSGVGGGP